MTQHTPHHHGICSQASVALLRIQANACKPYGKSFAAQPNNYPEPPLPLVMHAEVG